MGKERPESWNKPADLVRSADLSGACAEFSRLHKLPADVQAELGTILLSAYVVGSKAAANDDLPDSIVWDGGRQQFVATMNGEFIGALGYHQGQDTLDEWLTGMADILAKSAR